MTEPLADHDLCFILGRGTGSKIEVYEIVPNVPSNRVGEVLRQELYIEFTFRGYKWLKKQFSLAIQPFFLYVAD